MQKYIFLNFVFRIHKLIRIMEVKHIYENSKVLHSKENKLFHLYLKIVRRILVRFRAEIFYFSDFLPVNLLWKKKKRRKFFRRKSRNVRNYTLNTPSPLNLCRRWKQVFYLFFSVKIQLEIKRILRKITTKNEYHYHCNNFCRRF